MKVNESVQLVLSIRRKAYEKDHETGEHPKEYNRRFRTILKISPTTAYDIIIAGYSLTQSSIRELKVRRNKNGDRQYLNFLKKALKTLFISRK